MANFVYFTQLLKNLKTQNDIKITVEVKLRNVLFSACCCSIVSNSL